MTGIDIPISVVRQYAAAGISLVVQASRLKGEFERQTVDGVEFWLSPGLAAKKPAKAGRAYLLPPFDEYTISYADRGAVVDREQLAASGHGIGSNLIIDGRLAGLWKRTLKRDTVIVEITPLRSLSAKEKALVPAAVEPYAKFLGLTPEISGI